MLVDVFLASGVCVTVPDGTDPESPEGYQLIKDAAALKFLAMLQGNGYDIEAEVYEPATGTTTGEVPEP